MVNEKTELLELDTLLKSIVTTEQAWHYSIIPKQIEDNYLLFWISELVSTSEVEKELQVILGKNVNTYPISPEIIKNSLLKHYPKTNNQNHSDATFASEDDFLVNLFQEARALNSSDIHIEIYQSDCRVRMRKDGMLIERHKLQYQDYPALVNRIKIKANLDISEKRLPQDGRIFIDNTGKSFDVRVSIIPTFYGEKVVMRLLRTDNMHVELATIGLTKNQHETYWKAVQKQNGIILISGPTGSGKTTTLYSTLKMLNSDDKNILTIEDPIEYTLRGVNQVQVKESIGLTFSKAMRSFLRQDPNIIMLGEIRDQETAQMAIRLALTGHLVLSTIHTNSAWGTVSRLIDMDVPPFLIANTLNVSAAQRLIRTLCTNCKVPDTDESKFSQLKDLDIKLAHLSRAVGCENCYFTGYSGRQAVFEVLPIDSSLVGAIHNNQHSLGEFFKERNIETLRDRVLQMLTSQQTSFEEAYPLLLST